MEGGDRGRRTDPPHCLHGQGRRIWPKERGSGRRGEEGWDGEEREGGTVE